MVRITRLNWVVVLQPTTDLFGGPDTEELDAAFRSAWAEFYQGIVINLSDVHRINSTGVGVLVNTRVMASRTGTKTAFCCVCPDVDQMFKLVFGESLPSFQPFFQTESEAVRYCSER